MLDSYPGIVFEKKVLKEASRSQRFQSSRAFSEQLRTSRSTTKRKRSSASCGVEVLSSSLFAEGDADVAVPSRKVIKSHNAYASSPCTERKNYN